MKITFEFASIKDMLDQLPKVSQLMTGDDPAEDRIAKALEDDPTALIMKITPADGMPFTEDQKEAIKATISQFVETARIEKIEKLREELAPQSGADDEPESKPEDEKATEVEESSATETEARAALNGLVKSRSNAAVKLVFHKLGVKNFRELEDYSKAVGLAAAVDGMTDDEYEAALKEAGIKGGKK